MGTGRRTQIKPVCAFLPAYPVGEHAVESAYLNEQFQDLKMFKCLK
jgi:hypothetical protein